MPDEIDASRQLAADFLEALSSGDADRILSLYTEDATVWTAGSLPISGRPPRAAVRALCEGLLGAFPDGLNFELRGTTAEPDRVAVEARGHGLHASGQRYEQEYHFLLVLRGGLIAEVREYFDTEHARAILIPDGN